MTTKTEKKGNPLPLLIILLAVAVYLLFPTIKGAIVPKTIDETLYSAYGNATDNWNMGVFKIEVANPDYTRTVWYRTDLSEANSPQKQVGTELLSYPRLKTVFSNKDIDSVYFCYCINLAGGGYDKVLMVSVTREQFKKITASSYSGENFYRYFDLHDADKHLFPNLQSYIN